MSSSAGLHLCLFATPSLSCSTNRKRDRWLMWLSVQVTGMPQYGAFWVEHSKHKGILTCKTNTQQKEKSLLIWHEWNPAWRSRWEQTLTFMQTYQRNLDLISKKRNLIKGIWCKAMKCKHFEKEFYIVLTIFKILIVDLNKRVFVGTWNSLKENGPNETRQTAKVNR